MLFSVNWTVILSLNRRDVLELLSTLTTNAMQSNTYYNHLK